MSGNTLRVARNAPGLGLSDAGATIDMARMRRYRLARVQAELEKASCGGCVLLDPVNRRYATGASMHSLFQFHLPSRYAFVPASGKAVLFQGVAQRAGSELAETVDEVRPAQVSIFFYAGRRMEERAAAWAEDISDLMKSRGGNGKRVAVDRLEPNAVFALQKAGLEVINAQEMLERARLIKSDDEVACMAASISVAEIGIARMREALRPGITENELLAVLHHANIAHGGEWIEGKLLGSGANANPWGRECTDKIIRAGELVAFDTDMVGPFGYCADVSRTFLCPPGAPTDEQRRLYRIAVEQLDHNLALVRPGVSFREFAQKAWPIPEEFRKNRYGCLAHGIGMCDEYPALAHEMDWADQGEDGVLEEGMAICVESYIGAEGGCDGVKLEEQIVVTRDGYQKLSTFPFERELLA